MASWFNIKGTSNPLKTFLIGSINSVLIKSKNSTTLNVRDFTDNVNVNIEVADTIIPTLTTTTIGVNDSVKTQIEALGQSIGDSKLPNGFVNRTDSTLAYTLNTRTLNISGTFTYYNLGVRYNKVAVNESIQHGTSIGTYYVSYKGATLSVSLVDVFFNILTDAPVAIIYYNGTAATTYWNGANAIVLEERHGTTLDPEAHFDMHNNIGAYIVGGGFAMNGTYAVATGTGGLVDCSYGVDSGTIADEDIKIVTSALTDNAGVGNQYPIFYKTGSSTEWRWITTNLPLLKNVSNDILYNQFTGGAWQLTALTTGADKYVNMYLCVVPFYTSPSGYSYRFVWIMGQTLLTNLATAQAESILSLDISGLPFQELAPIWKITMRRANGYSTDSGHARIESTQKIAGTKISVLATYVPQNHNNLSNRTDPNSHPATAISTDTTNFNNNLSIADTDVQKALDTIDNLVLGGTATEAIKIMVLGGIGGW